jgi:hypothetical protein
MRHNDTRHNGRVLLCRVSFMLSVTHKPYYAMCHYAECHYAECLYAECHHAECHHAECRYAECRYSECRGAINSTSILTFTA